MTIPTRNSKPPAPITKLDGSGTAFDVEVGASGAHQVLIQRVARVMSRLPELRFKFWAGL